jgi:hypothetical protein
MYDPLVATLSAPTIACPVRMKMDKFSVLRGE